MNTFLASKKTPKNCHNVDKTVLAIYVLECKSSESVTPWKCHNSHTFKTAQENSWIICPYFLNKEKLHLNVLFYCGLFKPQWSKSKKLETLHTLDGLKHFLMENACYDWFFMRYMLHFKGGRGCWLAHCIDPEASSPVLSL